MLFLNYVLFYDFIKTSSMSTAMSTMQAYAIAEESYCTPWDLKRQEEKFKLLNEQHQLSSLSNIESIMNVKQPVPDLPPLPPGGLIPTCKCSTIQSQNSIIENLDLSMKNLNLQTTGTTIDTAHNTLFALTSPLNKRGKKVDLSTINYTQPMSFAAAILHFKQLSSSIQDKSLHKTQTAYERPWNSMVKHSLNSSYLHSDDLKTVAIDHYSWYHHRISRRQAENVLQAHSSGSFLVRQSESGSQNDYSLSIRTAKGCVHMRICYSDGFYILGECSRPFSSISCMINYFSQIPVPIRGAAHIKLGVPVSRSEILSSSSHEDLL